MIKCPKVVKFNFTNSTYTNLIQHLQDPAKLFDMSENSLLYNANLKLHPVVDEESIERELNELSIRILPNQL
ncbi:hypothetical protein RCL_jg18648.t1 [Rhizophagus clarus]|uniref:Uncharacterized protein n=1 Tax=Rhizophagus clarus TaxID=94130 RepID=A0A8H3QRM1_9GLOM|nr:hypothetical protein RCL_jg18648.t1 [Rhizophagus clarus]